MPMRSVPHRVVCLLGMDDGVFPRKSPRDGDDLMLADPHVGDRDARTEDRQLLLDALLAATDQLIVTYTGNDERTNLAKPPAVPVGELLDVIDRTVRTDEGPARERVEVRHPLQPFDPKNFTVGELVPERAWSFDPVTLNGARALTTERAPTARLPRRPAAGGDGAARGARGPRALRRASHPRVPQTAARHQRRGLLRRGRRRAAGRARCAGALGRRAAAARRGARGREHRGVRRRRDRARDAAPGPTRQPRDRQGRARSSRTSRRPRTRSSSAGAEPASVDVKVALEDGRTLSGTVPGVYGDVLRTVTYSRVNARHRLAAYVRWLALTAAHPERPFAAATIGQARRGRTDSATITIARIPPLADDAAARSWRRKQLATLVDLYDRGMREPLPLACMSSAAYAAGRVRRRRRRQGRAQGVGVGLEASPRRTPTSSTSSSSAASSASTS